MTVPFERTKHSHFVDSPSRVPKVTSRALHPAAYLIYTPIQKHVEALRYVFLVHALAALDEGLELSEELLYWIEVRRVRWQAHELHACVSTHLRDAFSMVERCVVHHKY